MNHALSIAAALAISGSALAAQVTVNQYVSIRDISLTHASGLAGTDFSSAAVGHTGLITLVYETSTADSNPNTGRGFFSGAIVSLALEIGAQDAALATSGINAIQTWNNQSVHAPDSDVTRIYASEAGSLAGVGDSVISFSMFFGNASGAALSSDIMPLSISNAGWDAYDNPFDSGGFGSYAMWEMLENIGDINGDSVIDYRRRAFAMDFLDGPPAIVIPLPTGAGLAGAGLLILGARRRR